MVHSIPSRRGNEAAKERFGERPTPAISSARLRRQKAEIEAGLSQSLDGTDTRAVYPLGAVCDRWEIRRYSVIIDQYEMAILNVVPGHVPVR